MKDESNPWNLTVELVSIRETSRDCWRLTFDGRVLGDSRGYSKERAIVEARNTVNRAPQYYKLDETLITL